MKQIKKITKEVIYKILKWDELEKCMVKKPVKLNNIHHGQKVSSKTEKLSAHLEKWNKFLEQAETPQLHPKSVDLRVTDERCSIIEEKRHNSAPWAKS